jgi:hypothetical protein
MKALFIKKFKLLIGFIIISFISLAQSPESMNYQAVIRNSSGTIIANQSIGIRIKILQGSANGSTVYNETFTPTSNAYGMVSLQIGTGSVVSGNFSSIDWGNNSYFVETAADVLGGSNYSVISTTQFMSVPYALYAKSAGSSPADNDWTETGSNIYRSTGNVGIGTLTPTSKLDVNGDINLTGDLRINGVPQSFGGALSGLEQITENGNTGFRLTGSDPNNYGDIGENSTDFSTQDQASSTRGATAPNAFAAGHRTTASGWHSTAFGQGSTASGNNSVAAIGGTSSGAQSLSLGYQTNSSGQFSRSIGVTATASGERSTAIGSNVTASANRSTAIGGDGTIASGDHSLAMGQGNTASGNNSVAIGYATTASGNLSTSMGENTQATGGISTAMGGITQATAFASTAMGHETRANGAYSTSMGRHSTASASYSIAMGFDTDAESAGCLAIGRYNIGGGNPTTWDSNDPAFEIGNGVNASNRSNAFQVLQNGNTTINGQLTLSDGTSSITFPNSDGSSGQVLQTDGSGTLTWSSSASGVSKLNDLTDGLTTNSSIYLGSPPSNNSGSYNTALGDGANESNTSGNNNTAIGYEALAASTTGSGSTAVGYQALKNNTNGGNTAVGYQSQFTSGGGYNVSLGQNSLFFNTSAHNVAIGYSSLWQNTGNSNTMVGHQSGHGITSGGYNVGVGRGTLWDLSTGSYNTTLGYNADVSLSSASNQIVLGYNATGQADNSVTLGNSDVTAVYMAQDAGATVYAGGMDLKTNSSSDGSIVSLANSDDSHRLRLFSGHSADPNPFMSWETGDPLRFATSGSSGSWQEHMRIQNGNVGIGTTNPSQKLHVEGNVYAHNFWTPSDLRFKEDFIQIENALENVLKLSATYYNYKNSSEFKDRGFPTSKQIGFIAQDLMKIYPEIVNKGMDGYLKVDYSKLTPILVEAIKDQQKKIDKLETELGLIKNYLNIKEE